ncbi:MAG: ATP-binding protein [bacterium]
MLTRISITNFRGLRDFSARIEPLCALLGPNSSGKTTVLHAVRIACDLLRFALRADGTCRVESRDGVAHIAAADKLLVPDVTALFALSDWQALFVDQAVGDGVQATIRLDFAPGDPIEAFEVRLTCARNQQLKLDVDVFATAAIERVAGLPRKSPHINQILTGYIVEHAPRAVLVPPFYGTVPGEEYRARVVIDRLLGTGDQSHVVRNLIAGLDADRFRFLNVFLEDAIGARLSYRTSGDDLQTESPLRVTFRDSNGELELSAAGAGLINLVALYAALARWRHEAARRAVIFLLDEPEAHLAPRLQAQSAARLGRLVVDEFGAQLIMATHSVDILNRLSQDGALLLRCDRSATPSVTTLSGHAALFADLATWADLTPYTAINFLASRRVVFVEGRSDQALLPLLGRLLFRNNVERLAAFEQWAFVELQGTGNRRLAPLLARLLENDVVRATPDQRPFQIEVVLDRDYAQARTPGTTTAPDGSSTTTVWSRHSIESMFIEPEVLVAWISALLDPAPADLARLVEEAIRCGWGGGAESRGDQRSGGGQHRGEHRSRRVADRRLQPTAPRRDRRRSGPGRRGPGGLAAGQGSRALHPGPRPQRPGACGTWSLSYRPRDPDRARRPQPCQPPARDPRRDPGAARAPRPRTEADQPGRLTHL